MIYQVANMKICGERNWLAAGHRRDTSTCSTALRKDAFGYVGAKATL